MFAIGNVTRDFIASLCLIILGIRTAKVMRDTKVITNQKSVNVRKKTTTKATKMLVVVVIVFSICIIPLDVFQLMMYSFFNDKRYSEFIEKHYADIVLWNTYLHILQMANSSSNIVVYSRMHTDFTKGILACGRRGKDLVRNSLSRVTYRSVRSLSGGGRHSKTSVVIDENLNMLNMKASDGCYTTDYNIIIE